MPVYRLTYFDARGLAEICRLIFAYAGVEYEDIRVPIGCLTAERKSELGVKWGHLPVLEFGGRSFSQSYAIGRYLARKYGLVGSDEFDELKADEYIDIFRDYFIKWVPLFFDSTPEEKKVELKRTLMETDNPRHMRKFEDILNENAKSGLQWLIGSKITWADICLAHFITHFDLMFSVELSKDYPAVSRLVETVFSTPGIKEWVERRPNTKF